MSDLSLQPETMTPSEWKSVSELFSQALTLPSAERVRFLKEARVDPKTRAEALQLLESHEASGAFLEGNPLKDQKRTKVFRIRNR